VKTRSILGGMLVCGLLFLGGCSAHRPCPIIPAQLELAEERAKLADDQFLEVSEELERIQGNLARLEENISKLEEEKAILLELIGEGGDEQ